MSKLTKFELDELEFKNQEYNRVLDAAEDNGLPECPNYMAHPQSVWFNEHWRPVIEQLKAENGRLAQSELECRQMYNEFVGDLNNTRLENTKLKIRIEELETEIKSLINNGGEQ